MKKLMILAMLVMGSMTAFAQVSKEEQELIDLSNQKWAWMAEKDADRLAELFLDNAQSYSSASSDTQTGRLQNLMPSMRRLSMMPNCML